MATYDLNAAKTRLGDYTKNTWSGAGLEESDYQDIGTKVGYTGGDIDDKMLSNAQGIVDQYGMTRGWTRSAAPPPPAPRVTAGPDPWTGPGPKPVDGSVPPATGSAPGSLPASGGSPDLQGILGAGAPVNASQQASQDALMRLLSGAQKAATISDPDLQPVADAYRSRRQRGYEAERRGIAERAAATGTAQTGGFDTAVAGALQGANRDTAAFEAGLVKDRIDDQRQELLQAIQLANQSGDAQAARDLQRQLALLNATMQQQDIDLRRTLGGGDLDLRRMIGFGGLDLNRELGRGDLDLRNRTLSQQGALGRGDLALRLMQSLLQNDQFFSQLGLNAAQIQALLNQSAVQSLL